MPDGKSVKKSILEFLNIKIVINLLISKLNIVSAHKIIIEQGNK